jgi:hypothetical protein
MFEKHLFYFNKSASIYKEEEKLELQHKLAVECV